MIRNNSKILKQILNLLIIFLIFFKLGCSSHSNLTPTGEGNIDAVLSLGGPFIPVAETKVPTPYISAGANYGLSANINLDANLHITSLFYELAGFDFGATWFPYLNEGLTPTWGIQPRLLMFGSFKSDVNSRFRVYPIISSSVAWKLGNGLIYSGLDFVYPLTTPDYDEEAVEVIFSPFAGYRWELGKNMKLLTELKWHGANVQGDQLAVEYITIGGYGALTIMFSLQKRF